MLLPGVVPDRRVQDSELCVQDLYLTEAVMLFQASPDEMEGQLDNGLIIGHAYSITDVRYVSTSLPGDSVKCSQLVYRDVHSYRVVKHVVAQIIPFNSL